MKIDVYYTPLGLNSGDLTGRAVVVIDVLRASSTIVTALAAGAKAIVPAASSEEAVRLTSNLEKNGIVLAGERRSLKIEGFGLGNSPREMTPESVGGKSPLAAVTPHARSMRSAWARMCGSVRIPTASPSCPFTRIAASRHELQGSGRAPRDCRPARGLLPGPDVVAPVTHRQLGPGDRRGTVAAVRRGGGRAPPPRRGGGARRGRTAGRGLFG